MLRCLKSGYGCFGSHHECCRNVHRSTRVVKQVVGLHHGSPRVVKLKLGFTIDVLGW